MDLLLPLDRRQILVSVLIFSLSRCFDCWKALMGVHVRCQALQEDYLGFCGRVFTPPCTDEWIILRIFAMMI
jgi:hypothetical protein